MLLISYLKNHRKKNSMQASIPQVMGTEHEYIITIPDPNIDQLSRWREEEERAIKLLKEIKKRFYPNLNELKRSENLIRTLREAYLEIHPRTTSRELTSITSEEFEEIFAYQGYMTPLGGRFYIDHIYFEGATPECDDPFTLLACELAQEELIVKVFGELFENDPMRPRLYKNISDGKGNSQAAHRNFCVSKELWKKIVSPLTRTCKISPALARETKILATWHGVEPILTGAGKYGLENPRSSEPLSHPPKLQLSGRADFIEFITGIDTTRLRPLINQRHEPLADYKKFGRYHCICGDANRAEWPYLFKMGLLAILLGMLEDDAVSLDFFAADPVTALKRVSKDTVFSQEIEIAYFFKKAGSTLPALQILRAFLKDMGKYLASRETPEWCGKIYDKAVWAVEALENNSKEIGRVLDWKIKDRLIGIRLNAFNHHLNYHALYSPTLSYKIYCDNDLIERVISRDLVQKYSNEPPERTRAYFRAQFLKHFYESVLFCATDWQNITLYESPTLSPGPLITRLSEPLQLTKKECGNIFELEVSPEARFEMVRALLEKARPTKERKNG